MITMLRFLMNDIKPDVRIIARRIESMEDGGIDQSWGDIKRQIAELAKYCQEITAEERERDKQERADRRRQQRASKKASSTTEYTEHTESRSSIPCHSASSVVNNSSGGGE